MKPIQSSPAAYAILLLVSSTTKLGMTFSLGSPAGKVQAEWKKNDVPPIVPPRSGHVSFRTDDFVYTFGGYAEDPTPNPDGSPNRYCVNDLWRFPASLAASTQGWEKIETAVGADNLAPRLAAAMTVLNGKPTLFGGWDSQKPGTGGVILDTVHQLDLSTHKWMELKGCNVPGGPTSRHVALTIPGGKQALVHNHRCVDHVLLFDDETKEWKEQKTMGAGPSPRGLHAACMMEGTADKALFFGGAAQDGTMSNEAFLLDTTTFKWTKVDIEGDCPSPRASPCLCSLTDGRLVMFGGAKPGKESGLVGLSDLWLLTVDCEKRIGRWELLLGDETSSPPGRNAATLTKVEGEMDKEQRFLLQGGWAPFRETWADVYTLHVRSEE